MKYLLQQLRLCSTLWPGGCISCNQFIVEDQYASAYFRLKKYLTEGPGLRKLADLQKRMSPSTFPSALATEVYEIAAHRTIVFTGSL